MMYLKKVQSLFEMYVEPTVSAAVSLNMFKYLKDFLRINVIYTVS